MERRLAVIIIIIVIITVIGQVKSIWGSNYTPGDRGSTVVKVLQIGTSLVRSQLVSVDFSLI